MNWKKKLFKESRLYIILDKDICKDIFGAALQIRNSGLNIVQLRAKNAEKKQVLKDAKRLKSIFEKSRTVFIINDHADIAKLIDADGLHIGQEDLPIEAASKRVRLRS
jgi:thiamine-phosphate pyrophosphorylase